VAAERGTIWARPECFRDDPDVAEPYVDLLERRQVLVGPGQPHWELIGQRARASLDERGPLELPLEPTSAAAFVLDELLGLLVHALARRAAEDGRAVAAGARADGCWRVRLAGPLSPASARTHSRRFAPRRSGSTKRSGGTNTRSSSRPTGRTPSSRPASTRS
jgi:hypothetical protein